MASQEQPTLDRSELFELLIHNIPVGIFVVDRNGVIVEFNKVAQQITGYSREEALGKKCAEVLRSSLCHTNCPLFGPDTSNRPKVSQRATIRTKDQREVPIMFTSASLIDEKGQMKGGIEMFRDISESERLEKHRRVLISMFAHDLKAPVAIAGGFLTRLLKGKAGALTPKQEEYLRAIDREIRRLDNYIHSFLNILKMEAGQVPLSLEPCSIDKALDELTEGFKMQAAGKSINLRTEVPDSLTLVMADKEQLQRVVSNLLDNAIKYAPEGSEVLIRVYETPDEVVCMIKDSGPGIDPEDLPHIFDPFYRGRRGGVGPAKAGSGLGLAVVRSIVEAHGGKVWVVSEPGQGTIFYFTIPKKHLRRGSSEGGSSKGL